MNFGEHTLFLMSSLFEKVQNKTTLADVDIRILNQFNKKKKPGKNTQTINSSHTFYAFYSI